LLQKRLREGATLAFLITGLFLRIKAS
jgi:hypothetical protein